MSADSDRYSGIWSNLKNINLLVTDNYPKTKTSTYNILCHYKKPKPPLQVHAPSAVVTFAQSGDTEKKRQSQEMTGYHFYRSHAIAVSRKDIMREIAHH